MKTSAIITAFKEPQTIQKAISSIGNQKIIDEIIVMAPDNETLNKAKELKKQFKELILLKDPGEGKPVALNFAVSKAKGEILILTDGDVYISENSLKLMLNKMKDKNIGAVSGHPISLNNKKTMFGFWAYLLTSIADERRKKALKEGRRIFCSGYLFAIRKSLFPKLSPEILSEDGLVSHLVYEKGYKINYSSESKVYVKYPTNLSDWIKQKKRSAGGYNQIKSLLGAEIRSFRKESFGGFGLFKFIKNPKELFYLISLFFARIYLWAVIYKDINIKKKSHKDIWLRIESTK